MGYWGQKVLGQHRKLDIFFGASNYPDIHTVWLLGKEKAISLFAEPF